MSGRITYGFERLPEEVMRERATGFFEVVRGRRSVRDFSGDAIPEGVIEACIEAAGTAPSGANLQPWHFAVVRDEETKARIREAAEAEERAFYEGRAPDEWLEVLAALGTDAEKAFLEEAPVLIVIFQKSKVPGKDAKDQRTYYAKESVGIATGFLIAALHHAGVATLTHTPSPMGFVGGMDKFPNRPENMRGEKIESAASGGRNGNAAHFPSGVVPVRFIGVTQRRSRRLASRKMDSRRPARQFVQTAWGRS